MLYLSRKNSKYNKVMRKFKNFMFIAIGLGLVSTGCNNDKGNETPVDNRDKVVGTYPVKVEAPVVGDLYTNLALTKTGESDLKASATAEIPAMGEMTIDIVLSELKEYNDEGGETVTGYLFKVAEQGLSIMGQTLSFKGTGAYAEGYDGKVYKNETESFISLEIGDATGVMKVQVETGVYTPPAEDNRDKVVGTYPVKVEVSVLPVELYADLALAKDGDSDLKASATVEVPGMGQMNIELVLSGLKEYSEEDGAPVDGYLYEIAEQTLTIMGTPMPLAGTGAYAEGFDGKVYKNETDAFISLMIGDASGAITVKVETGAYTPPADNRDDVVGTYPVSVSVPPLLNNLGADLQLAKEGNSGLKASASVEVPLIGAMNIEVVLSDLLEYNDEEGQAVTGYFFKIAPQELSVMGSPVTVTGTGAYTDGYDGKVYKGEAVSFISLKVASEDGTINVVVETTA